LALLVLILLGILAWQPSAPRAASADATPVFLPRVMREGLPPTSTATATNTPSVTQTSPATATVSVTPNATSTATATATPTEMPVTCFPTSGTYPIAVRDTLLYADGFVNPDGYYSDETYQNKTWKRVPEYVPPTHPNGGFSWLRWRAQDNSTVVVLTAMLTGTGNLSQGFNEAPWPNNPNFPPKPNGYPLYPGQLNNGDWVYNFSGVFNGSSVAAALDYHIANKPPMVLPIQDLAAISGGVNSNYHVARPGAFLLIGYRLSGPAYLDLVYIEEPATLPCTG
jgi:hypothetical protein